MASGQWYIRDVPKETQTNLNTIATNGNMNTGEVVTKLAEMVVSFAHRNGVSYAQALAKIIEIVEKV
jgi:hypothetical protein